MFMSNSLSALGFSGCLTPHGSLCMHMLVLMVLGGAAASAVLAVWWNLTEPRHKMLLPVTAAPKFRS